MPAVSVVLPTYNRSQTLERAARSVLAQSFSDFELIVVDDGSTDNTPDLIHGLADRDSRVRAIRHPVNLGQSRARNTGIASAKGRFIAFQDSDDEWLPAKLGRQVEVLEGLPDDVGMVYCFVYYVGAEGMSVLYKRRIMPDEPHLYKMGLQYLFRGIGIQACLFRREVFDVCGGFDELMDALEDMELLIRVARKYRFSCIDEPLLLYHRSANSISKNHLRNLRAAQYILEKYHADIRSDRRILSEHYRRISRLMKKVGRRSDARILQVRAWLSDLAGRFI